MTEVYDPADEPRDKTKLVWLGIGVLMVGMVIALWVSGRVQPNRTVVQAKHILVAFDPSDPLARSRALDTITDVREQLVANPGSFGRLAKEYSDDPLSGSRSGYLGTAERGAYVEAFENYVWSAPIGELSEIVTTMHGFHLIVVVNRSFSDIDEHNLDIEKRILAGEEPKIPE